MLPCDLHRFFIKDFLGFSTKYKRVSRKIEKIPQTK